MYAVFSTTHGRPSVTLAHLGTSSINIYDRRGGDGDGPNSHALEIETDSSVDIETMG